MALDWLYYFGFIASGMAIFALVSQTYRIIKIKNAFAVSYNWLIFSCFSMLFWFLFGMSMQDPIIIFVNAFGTAIQATTTFLKWYYERNHNAH